MRQGIPSWLIGPHKMLVVLVLLLGLGPGLAVSADGDAAAFYDGKTIKFIVPYKAGGGYDTYSRLLAPALEKHTGALGVRILRARLQAGSKRCDGRDPVGDLAEGRADPLRRPVPQGEVRNRAAAERGSDQTPPGAEGRPAG